MQIFGDSHDVALKGRRTSAMGAAHRLGENRENRETSNVKGETSNVKRQT